MAIVNTYALDVDKDRGQNLSKYLDLEPLVEVVHGDYPVPGKMRPEAALQIPTTNLQQPIHCPNIYINNLQLGFKSAKRA